MSFIQQGVIGSSSSSGASLVSIVGNSTIGSGSQTVTTAGTRVQLSVASVPCKKVIIQGGVDNGGWIYVGDSTVASSNGYAIAASQSVIITPSNLNLIYIDSSVNGEGVKYLYEN